MVSAAALRRIPPPSTIRRPGAPRARHAPRSRARAACLIPSMERLATLRSLLSPLEAATEALSDMIARARIRSPREEIIPAAKRVMACLDALDAAEGTAASESQRASSGMEKAPKGLIRTLLGALGSGRRLA